MLDKEKLEAEVSALSDGDKVQIFVDAVVMVAEALGLEPPDFVAAITELSTQSAKALCEYEAKGTIQ